MKKQSMRCNDRIEVIIVNYKTANLVIESINSIFKKSSKYKLNKINIIDNNSGPNQLQLLETAIAQNNWKASVKIYPQPSNLGFGCGNNVAFELLARSDQCPEKALLLNPDARLKNDAIAILSDFLDDHPDVAMVGAKIEKPGGVPVTAAFRFPGIISEFSGALSFGPITKLLSRFQVPRGPDLQTGPTDWVAGAAVMARIEALRSVNYFDPTYFLYYEEVDLMYRLKRAGWKIWYVAEAEVIHHEGAATSVRSGETGRKRLPAYLYESWRHYFHKNHGRPYALLASVARVCGVTGHFFISFLRGKTTSAPLFFYRDFWKLVMKPLLGL